MFAFPRLWDIAVGTFDNHFVFTHYFEVVQSINPQHPYHSSSTVSSFALHENAWEIPMNLSMVHGKFRVVSNTDEGSMSALACMME
jgi:hypothetical protein